MPYPLSVSRSIRPRVALASFCLRSRIGLIAALTLSLFSVASGQSTADSEVSKIIYVESPKASHRPTQEKLEACVRLLQKEIGVPGARPPKIVVIHLASSEAAKFGLTKTKVKLRLHDERSNPSEPDELWLVGEPSAADYTLGMSMLLEHHFGVSRDEEEQRRTVARVARILDATVSVAAN